MGRFAARGAARRPASARVASRQISLGDRPGQSHTSRCVLGERVRPKGDRPSLANQSSGRCNQVCVEFLPKHGSSRGSNGGFAPDTGCTTQGAMAREWPMSGVPKVLHLDNAADFKSRALRSGCREYDVDLMYRPVGRPHKRTLGTTVGKDGCFDLREFEQWLAIGVARRYHHGAHRGLLGATPADLWKMQEGSADSRQLPATGGAELRFLIRLLPAAPRTIQA